VALRRSAEDRIQALEAQIEALKQRKVRKQQRRDPTLKQIQAAVRSVDKALAASGDHTTRAALGEARNTLAACLTLAGATPKRTLVPQARQASAGVSEEALLSYVRTNPGQRGEQIAGALGTATSTLRPVMKRLVRAGRVKTAGQARAMSYAAV
jgi:DNA-binding IscR family transcriptional regulator